jgi:hypothetical protein
MRIYNEIYIKEMFYTHAVEEATLNGSWTSVAEPTTGRRRIPKKDFRNFLLRIRSCLIYNINNRSDAPTHQKE